ncbi:MAG: hypothetical protein ACRYFS_24545 [Janthinobacterium lividum]
MAEGCRGPSQALKSMQQLGLKSGSGYSIHPMELKIHWREIPDAQYKPKSIQRIVAFGKILYQRVPYSCVRDNRGNVFMDLIEYALLEKAMIGAF